MDDRPPVLAPAAGYHDSANPLDPSLHSSNGGSQPQSAALLLPGSPTSIRIHAERGMSVADTALAIGFLAKKFLIQNKPFVVLIGSSLEAIFDQDIL